MELSVKDKKFISDEITRLVKVVEKLVKVMKESQLTNYPKG